jgi:2-phosphosulfolactate phosphatase
VPNPYEQQGFRARFDWGVVGADTVAPGASLVAVVDVLSFTTTLSVAVEQGIEVLPYRWRDQSAHEHARRHGAVLGVGRGEVAGPDQVSLSPGSIRRSSGIRRLVLPSPNGSTIAHQLAATSVPLLGVCLRNAGAAAAWTARHLPAGGVVAVVAAGERWKPDGSLRPAVEDLWGAGAYLARLDAVPRSPEAQAAVAAFRAAEPTLAASLAQCASGRELVGYGYPDDVTVAGELDASTAVPLFNGAGFVAAPE